MDFNDILKEIKNTVFSLFKEHYGELKNSSKKEIEAFIESSKEKLQRWSQLLKDGGLSTDEFQWLLKSQKDAINLKALQQGGISKISVGLFKNKILNTVSHIILSKVL